MPVTDALIAKAEFGAGVTSALRARRFVSGTLRGWECTPLIDAAVLLVNELVTNALVHARSRVEVLIRLLPGGLRVEVRDHSTRPPRLQTPMDDATSGRGLWLVDQMADTWGVEPAPGGKRVWFELAR
jgi:anti-sigma regulatory factor (Ser/Thr protein kinase)